MEPAVDVTGLRKLFNGSVAVDSITFRIWPSEILGLMGPNGAGKTTTIQMLLGLTEPDAGEINILGKSLKRHRSEILSLVNFSSSYVSLPYSLTVRENLLVFAKLYGVEDPPGRIRTLLETFEIKGLEGYPVRKLSSGEMTRVCLAKALLNSPRVLFLDEPTASLDPDIADKTRRLLKRIRDEEGTSILCTSHNMKEMEEVSDRVIFLDKGRIIGEGAPEELKEMFQGSSLEEVFIKVARH